MRNVVSAILLLTLGMSPAFAQTASLKCWVRAGDGLPAALHRQEKGFFEKKERQRNADAESD